MKVLAFALVLLAVGAHAASIQADAPDQLSHMRTVLDMYLTRVKDSALESVNKLEDAEYAELKVRLTQRINDMYAQIKAWQASISPVTDSVVSTIEGATSEFRASVQADIDALRTDLKPKADDLRLIMDRHVEDYRSRVQPIMDEYYAKHNEEMQALRTKLEPVLTDLRTKFDINVEETKSALMPMVEAVRAKLSERLEELKTLAGPYVEEYKEQAGNAYSQVQSISSDDLEALKAKIEPLAMEIKEKFAAIFEAASATVMKTN